MSAAERHLSGPAALKTTSVSYWPVAAIIERPLWVVHLCDRRLLAQMRSSDSFRWMRPWSNLPVYLRSSDANWKDNVAHWVTLSNVIVFDGSDLSVSMATEWTIIKKKRAELRTILMTGGTQTPIGSNRDVANIEYQLTWLAAIRRLLIGSLTLAVASYLAFDIGGLGIAVGLILATLPTFLHRSLASSSRLELQTNIYQKLKHF